MEAVNTTETSVIGLMEAVSSSETSVSMYQATQRNIPEDSHFYPHSLLFPQCKRPNDVTDFDSQVYLWTDLSY
jgi:hypothetical protein